MSKVTKVRSHVRRTKSGKIVRVKEHIRRLEDSYFYDKRSMKRLQNLIKKGYKVYLDVPGPFLSPVRRITTAVYRITEIHDNGEVKEALVKCFAVSNTDEGGWCFSTSYDVDRKNKRIIFSIPEFCGKRFSEWYADLGVEYEREVVKVDEDRVIKVPESEPLYLMEG